MTPDQALKAIHEKQPIECTQEEWPAIRPNLQNLARCLADARNADAVSVLMEIRRLDAKHRFKVV